MSGLLDRLRLCARRFSLYDREETMGMNASAFNGNFLFSLGPNNEAGGDRTTACHLDIPLRGCAVKVDGIEVVKDGALSRA